MPVVKKAIDALVTSQGIGFMVDKLPICKIFYGGRIDISSNRRDSKICANVVPRSRIQKIRRNREEVLYRNSRRAIQKHQRKLGECYCSLSISMFSNLKTYIFRSSLATLRPAMLRDY